LLLFTSLAIAAKAVEVGELAYLVLRGVADGAVVAAFGRQLLGSVGACYALRPVS